MTDSERRALIAAARAFHEARTAGSADLAGRAEDLRQALGTAALMLATAALDDRGEAYLEEMAEALTPCDDRADTQNTVELWCLTGTTDPIAAGVVAGRRGVRVLRDAGCTPDVARGAILSHLEKRFMGLDKGLRVAILSAVAEGVDDELAAPAVGGV